jgi:hypothetical protein
VSLQQYLDRYAESEVQLLASLDKHWQQALVIPAYKETPEFLEQQHPDNCLLILVLNRPPDDGIWSWAKRIIDSLTPATWQNEHLSLHPRPDNCAVLLVDRCIAAEPIPAKQGVGLARKIGADIACQLLATNKLSSPWLGCSDADAWLPPDYWTALMSQPAAAACVFPFHHQREDSTASAIRLYELHMLYYVAGLRFAGSPYAWPTIGSCIGIEAHAYAQARGYPKKAGGEDFYLLNKLAKLGGVRHASSPQITLSTRLSDRVPFGTGPALRKIQMLDNARDFCSYHPDSFVYLKAAVTGLRQQPLSGETITAEQIADTHHLDSTRFSPLWQDFGCNEAIALARKNSRSTVQLQRQLMTWFDGFRSLKYIHACRNWLPDQALATCIEKAHWLTLPCLSNTTADIQLAAFQRQLADNRLRGPGTAHTNAATSPEITNIFGH